MSDSEYHAWYSAENDKVWGAAIYLDKQGNEVRCTCVDKDKQKGEYWCSGLPDSVYMGLVYKFVRSENKDPFNEQVFWLDNDKKYGILEQEFWKAFLNKELS